MKRIVFGLVGYVLWGAVYADSGGFESEMLYGYDGVVGTAPKDYTVTAAGGGLEQGANSINGYGFFSQTLSNSLYYEARLYLDYNTLSQNPDFPEVHVSDIHNPYGKGFAGFVGYNFNVTELLDILPYFRLNLGQNMNLVYEDANGNYIHSKSWATFVGSKFVFKLDKRFAPYVDYFLGYQHIYLNAEDNYVTSPIIAQVHQISSNFQFGVGIQASTSISIIPYAIFSTVFNQPEGIASLPFDQGGLAVNRLTVTQQTVGAKVSYAW